MKEKEFYTSKEVATLLGAKNSTVRKYASLLESYNYPINRDFAKNRIYTIENVNMFRELIDLSQKITLAKAADLLTTEYRQSEGEIPQESIHSEFIQIKERLHNQEIENQLLTNKIQNLEDHFSALLSLFQDLDEDKEFLSEFRKYLDKV